MPTPRAVQVQPIFGRWLSRRLHSAIPDMDRNELTQAMRLHSKKLVEELYEIAQRQMKYESERQARLDSKANGLLALVGLSLTVLFTFGGQFLFAQREHLRPSGASWDAALWLLLAASVAGILASLFAITALLVRRGYRTLDERAIFNGPQLQKYDALDKEDDGLKEYRRYLIVDMWEIVQQQFRLHERKASLIRGGQSCYVAFLLCLAAIGCLIVVFASHTT